MSQRILKLEQSLWGKSDVIYNDIQKASVYRSTIRVKKGKLAKTDNTYVLEWDDAESTEENLKSLSIRLSKLFLRLEDLTK